MPVRRAPQRPPSAVAAVAALAALLIVGGACGDASPAGTGTWEPPVDGLTSTCTAEPAPSASAGAASVPSASTVAPAGSGTSAAPAGATAPVVTAAPGRTTVLLPGADTAAWQVGASGPAVLAVQQRLASLGYWLGEATGTVTEETVHAVVAVQKAAGLERTGSVDAATRQALENGLVPVPRSGGGLVVEIDITHQLLLLVRDGALVAAMDTSTGRAGLETPVGTYTIYEAVDTADDGQGEYRPMFFYEPLALAIHGYESVPAVPYSHGCARLILPAMDVLWANGVGVGTTVLVYA